MLWSVQFVVFVFLAFRLLGVVASLVRCFVFGGNYGKVRKGGPPKVTVPAGATCSATWSASGGVRSDGVSI